MKLRGEGYGGVKSFAVTVRKETIALTMLSRILIIIGYDNHLHLLGLSKAYPGIGRPASTGGLGF